MSRWIDIKANDVRELLQEAWIRRELERLYAMGSKAVRRPDSLHGAQAHAGGSGRLPGGRVLSRRRPSTPSRMNRSCQRQTTGFDRPERRTISSVPQSSAVARITRARAECF